MRKKREQCEKKTRFRPPRRHARGHREVRRVQNPPGSASHPAKLCVRSVCMRGNYEMKVMLGFMPELWTRPARRARVRRIQWADRSACERRARFMFPNNVQYNLHCRAPRALFPRRVQTPDAPTPTCPHQPHPTHHTSIPVRIVSCPSGKIAKSSIIIGLDGAAALTSRL